MLGLGEEDLTFTVLVHAATALSTVVVFRQDIGALIRDVLRASQGLQSPNLHRAPFVGACLQRSWG